MPWKKVSIMEQRRELARLATQEGANRRELFRRFGVHHDTGYKWIGRWLASGELADRSRRPKTSPGQTEVAIEAAVLCVRDEHPAWGARKIARCLERDGLTPPAISTVHEILRRHGRIGERAGPSGPSYQRFEMEAPNLLWQMDFKGWVRLGNGVRCHPLTVLDDHSRYSIGLEACVDEQGSTVRTRLEKMFRHYGLPDAFFVDNGTPWGDASGQSWTRFGVFLLKLNIRLLHSRPYHPQSRGKNERFHRSLKAEVFALNSFRDLKQVQRALDRWREVYNFERPHQALDQQVPASRYRPSLRAMPNRLPEIVYDEGEIVRTVPTNAYLRFKGRRWKVPQAFCGERVAVRPLSTDGNFGVFFASHQIAAIDLRLQPS
jgi:transposase InsO family protein